MLQGECGPAGGVFFERASDPVPIAVVDVVEERFPRDLARGFPAREDLRGLLGQRYAVALGARAPVAESRNALGDRQSLPVVSQLLSNPRRPE